MLDEAERMAAQDRVHLAFLLAGAFSNSEMLNKLMDDDRKNALKV